MGSTLQSFNHRASKKLCSAADFFPTLRTLLGHRVYLIYLCVTIIQLNSLIGMVTYKPKYIEQHFRQSASKANFLMGELNKQRRNDGQKKKMSLASLRQTSGSL